VLICDSVKVLCYSDKTGVVTEAFTRLVCTETIYSMCIVTLLERYVVDLPG